MLHILFLILKIIGILLLIVLGLILSVLAIVLFVPVRYRVSAEKDSKIQAQVRLSWLTGLIRIQAGYDGGETGADVFLFGRSLLNRKPQKQKSWKRRNKRTTEQSKKRKAEQSREIKTELPQEVKTEQPRKTELEQIQEEQSVAAIPMLPERADSSESSVVAETQLWESEEDAGQTDAGKKTETAWNRITEKLTEVPRKIQSILQSIRQRIKRVVEAGKKLADRKEKLKATIGRWLDFWNLEVTQAAKTHVLKEIRYLFHHILPRKAEGQILVGLDDPATTGQLLGILYVLSAFTGNCLEIQGDFDRAVLEGCFQIKGHVRICHIAKAALSLLADKNIRQTVRSFRHMTA